MAEQVFKFTVTEEKTIEKVIQDENIHYIHMVFGRGEGFPEHNANATVYMSVEGADSPSRSEEKPANMNGAVF